MDHPVELQQGMVIALETYDGEGIDGARIEEMTVITDGDPEVISKFPCRELISCGCKY
jgi:Xaa-Pro aminopeptidase